MENTRSYLSRFSGLILFLVSLAVVGLLVFFTIRSARDNDQQTAQNTSSTTSENTDETEDNTDTTPQQNPDTAPAPTVAEEPAADEDEGQDETEPNSDETATDDETESGTVAAETSNDNLPNTGPESVFIGSLALAVLTGTIKSYLQSRRLLNDARRR